MFTEVTEPYEILIRYEGGVYKGAHFQSITHVKKDGVIISSTLGAAVPIKNAEGFAIEDVIGQVMKDQDEAVRQANEAVEAARTAAASEVAKVQEVVSERLAELDAFTIEKAEADLAAKDANIQSLLEQLAAKG